MDLKRQTCSLSVIIPVHNAAQFLPRCLDSVLAAQGVQFEVITVNDGSTDESGKILSDYASRYPTLRVATFDINQGVAAARNRGLDLATGDFILFVDADDRLLPGAVPRLLDAIMPQAPDISMCLHQTIQENGKPEVRDNLPAFLSSRLESGAENSISPVGETRRFFDLKNPSERRVSFELAVGNLWAWNGFFRREALGDLRFAPLGRCEDLLFGAQAYCRAQSMLFLPLVGYEYVRRPGSASSRDTFKNCVSAIEAAAGLFETIRLSGFLDQIEDLLFRKIRTLAFGTTLGPLLRLPACERKAAWDCWFRRFKPVFQMLEMNGLGRHALIRFCLNRESRFLVRLLLRLPVLVKAKILNVPGMRRWWLSARRRGTEHRGKECAA